MYLKRKFPTSTEKIVTRRLGIPDLGIPERSSREADQVAILSASSIIPVKRVDLILQVMQMLVSSGLRVKWTHLGDGPGRTALERALSVDTANSLRVELRGHVPLYEVRRELVSGRHDLFINLSLSEGAPVSLMEAQCVGMPVVATDVGGTSEVIFEAFNELVSSSASLIEICAAVRRAINRDSKECTWRREYWSAKYYAAANYTSWATEIREIARLSRV
jgi:glycosyltransferase involved in cell wall biosynthesis